MTFRTIAIFAAAAGSLLLVACGGGSGSGSTNPLDGVSAIDLTGAQTPQETVDAQAARARDIVDRADSLIASNAYGETNDPRFPQVVLEAECSDDSCTLRSRTTNTFTNDQLDVFLELDTSDLDTRPARVILTRHGITTFEDEASGEDADFRTYGAWMDHSAFAVNIATLRDDDLSATIRFGLAGGDLTGSRPAGAATWQGLMVGTPQTGAARGNYLQGDALLTFDLDTNVLDAEFTDINDLNRRAAHSTTSVRFADVPVAAGGTFGAGNAGNRIQGGFYGAGHAETAGVFEQSGIVGAFGAKNQP